MPALADHRSETRDLLSRRLAAEFATLTSDAVARCVADVQACMTHLGVDATPTLVERMAREHLMGRLKSRPPSGHEPDVPGRAAGGSPARAEGLPGGDGDR